MTWIISSTRLIAGAMPEYAPSLLCGPWHLDNPANAATIAATGVRNVCLAACCQKGKSKPGGCAE